MEKVRRFEDLEVFQRARTLCKEIYQLTAVEPFANDYRFVQQVRASAGSIMDNIAEGYEQNGNKEFVNFLYISKGSTGEVRSQITRAYDVQFIDETVYNQLYNEVQELGRMLYNLIMAIKQGGRPGCKYQ